MITKAPRTRLWCNPAGSDTLVQFRNDHKPYVWVHSNLGWVPIMNAPHHNEYEAEHFAEVLASEWDLTEASYEYAQEMAGWRTIDDE